MGTEQDSRHHRKLQDHDQGNQIEGLVPGMHHGQGCRSGGMQGIPYKFLKKLSESISKKRIEKVVTRMGAWSFRSIDPQGNP